jgi:hypothetical protein
MSSTKKTQESKAEAIRIISASRTPDFVLAKNTNPFPSGMKRVEYTRKCHHGMHLSGKALLKIPGLSARVNVSR